MNRTSAKEFRQIARQSLSGNWAVAIGTALIASLLSCYIAFIYNENIVSEIFQKIANFDLYVSSNISQAVLSEASRVWDSTHNVFSTLIFITKATVANVLPGTSRYFFLISVAITWTIGGALQMGYAQFYIDIIRYKKASFDNLWCRMSYIFTGFCMKFWTFLYVTLWSLLFVIPGILAAYSYAMAPYILAEYPNMSARSALAASKDMMAGNRWRYFCLQLSFIGWHILSAFIPFAAGSLFLAPYVETASATFYAEVSQGYRYV